MGKTFSKFLKISVVISLIASMFVYRPSPTTAGINYPNTHGLRVGTINENKDVIGGTSGIFITGNGMPNVMYGLSISGVNINGGYVGNVSSFSDLSEKADRGWGYVDPSDAALWVEKFGGNPGYVLGGNAIYSAEIYHGDITDSGNSYRAYNIAEIAAASGGRGNTNGTWERLANGDYFMTMDYQSSPQPEGWLSTDKSIYNVKEKVKITAGGKDYSFYDKGFIVNTIQVINKTTGTQWQKLITDNTIINGTGTPVDLPYLWSQTFEYTDTTIPGHYEVSLVLQDKHRRAVQGSASISNSKTIIAEFEVAPNETCDKDTSFIVSVAGESNVTLQHNGSGTYNLPTNINTIDSLQVVDSNTNELIGGTLTVGGQKLTSNNGKFTNILVTGPSTTISFESTDKHYCISYEFKLSTSTGGGDAECDSWDVVMDVQIDKDTGISTIQLASGGSRDIDKSKFNGADVFSPIKGDFFYKIGGVPSENGRYVGYTPGENASNTDKYLNIPFSDFTPVHILFVSPDGKCWVYTFRLVDSSIKIEPCPKVYQTVDYGDYDYVEVEDGDIIEVDRNGSIEMFANYNSTSGGKKPAAVWWELEYPDGTKKFVGGEFNENNNFHNKPIEKINIPYGYDAGTQYNVFFDQVGQYKLRHIYTDTIWDDHEPPCKWEITITVKNVDCDDLILEAESQTGFFHFTGSGTLEDPYTGSLAAGDRVWAGVRARFQGNLIETTQYTITGGHLTEPETRGGGAFADYFYSFDPPRMYTIHAKINYKGQICEKTIYIRLAPYNCDQASVSVKVNESSEELDNGTLRLVMGQQPSYTVDFQALYSGSSSGVTGDWVLKKNGSTSSYTSNGSNPFSHTFSDISPGTYTLTIKVKKDSLICEKTITIELEGIQCSDLRIHLYDSENKTWKTQTNGSVIRESINSSNPVDWKLVVTNSEKNPSEGGIAVKVTWTADLPNQSSTKPTEYARNGTGRGIYKVKAVVTDSAYPQLANCEFTVEVEILDEVTCGTMYIWVHDETNPNGKLYPNNSEIKYIVPAGGKVPMVGLIIGTSPTDPGAAAVRSDWTGTRPNEYGGEELFYVTNNVGNGTYTITAVTNDVRFPKGCRYEITVVVTESGGPTDPGGGGCTTCEPGGTIDGGKMKILVYDSENRLLTGQNDGVWEREPARIEVEIDQSKIMAALHQVDAEINQAIQKKIAELEQKYADLKYEGVLVTATPTNWSAQNNPQTKWPSHVRLNVDGPGGNSEFQLNPATPRQSNTFTLTGIPTQTTWRADLHAQNYHAKVDGFQIEAAYSVRFDVTFQECEMESPGEDEEGNPLPEEKVCKPGNDSDEIGNTYTINVGGDETWFEVFEPNATSVLAHTSEWLDYHSRDRYKQSQPGDFYAGERILTRVHLEERHRHPVSGKFPQIQGAKAWIYETGKNGGNLQSTLSLTQESLTLWKGASRNVPKLGLREEGVDTPLMGDKQKGFAKGGHYAVYFQVTFQYGITKGFIFPNKNTLTGHQESDYKRQFTIIANAWERQGIRNHTKQ
ncbi:hypothetical protein [Brevibacillus sp. SYSU BS000544]|uniref:hypothetical protein n=1 Tax=Brevibacillus sp. SYSU BS000544 TaxID=3416443 RepID=UPI003CE4F5CC